MAGRAEQQRQTELAGGEMGEGRDDGQKRKATTRVGRGWTRDRGQERVRERERTTGTRGSGREAERERLII